MPKKLTVAIIGCGRMGGAIANGLLRRGTASIRVFDVNRSLALELGIHARDLGAGPRFASTDTASEALRGADVAVVAVKPKVASDVLRSLGDADETLLISVMAGVETTTLRAATHHRIVRIMPNTPALVGEGVSVILNDGGVDPADIDIAMRIFGSLGSTPVVRDEKLMHAVTAVSASGPAFAAILVEAMADAGVAEGLPRETAYQLVREMFRGTMALLAQQHPGELKDGVSSPAGTTIAGVAELERYGARHAIIAAVRAAADRSRELGST